MRNSRAGSKYAFTVLDVRGVREGPFRKSMLVKNPFLHPLRNSFVSLFYLLFHCPQFPDRKAGKPWGERKIRKLRRGGNPSTASFKSICLLCLELDLV